LGRRPGATVRFTVFGENNLSVGLAIEIKLPDLITVNTMTVLRTDIDGYQDRRA
jgi:hypothetical protein